jgi:hypothetical protein
VYYDAPEIEYAAMPLLQSSFPRLGVLRCT